MSTIIASNISDGTTSVASTYVVNGSAKAWVNFNGTSTVAIRDSMNVGSITDNGSGDYTANFTAAMSDANYAMTACAEVVNGSGTQINSVGTLRVSSGTSYYTGSIRVVTNEGATQRVDSGVVSLAIFR
jgi:hypothetical protein